jgi:hypothetical protein
MLVEAKRGAVKINGENEAEVGELWRRAVEQVRPVERLARRAAADSFLFVLASLSVVSFTLRCPSTDYPLST